MASSAVRERDMGERDSRFGVQLRTRRRSVGLSQQELAERSGLHVRTIRNLELGHARWPYRNTLHRLADALDLSGAMRADFIAGADRRLGSGSDPNGQPGTVPQESRDAGLTEPDVTEPESASQAVSSYPAACTPVPRQLPAGIPHFTGRKAELDFLTAVVAEPELPGSGTVVISAIGGMAGVGKTALAVQWAHEHAASFPDGQLYADLRGFGPVGDPIDVAVVVRRFLDALHVPPARIPADTDAQFGLYRSMLAGKRMLIILDNASDASQVRPLLPGVAGASVLVTSRDKLTSLVALDGAVPLAVGLLEPEAARDLLGRRLGEDRVAREQAKADELADLCARLPLALNICAAYAAARPAMLLRELTARLRDTRLDLLSAGPGHADVRTVFSWSYRGLSAPAARVFRLLGLHPGPDVSLAALISLAALDLGRARLALDELTSANLLTEHLPGRYALHDLLRAYAVEQASVHDGEDERHAAIRRVLDHYLLTAHQAAIFCLGHSQPPCLPETSAGVTGVPLADWADARIWSQAEEAVLFAAISLAADTGFTAHAWQLAWSVEVFPEQWRRWQEQIATGQIALAAAERAGDQIGQAYVHRHLGRALSTGGRHADARAHLQRAVALFDVFGDQLSRADTELALAVALIELGEPDQALAYSQRSLDTYRAAGHDAGQVRALNDLGWNQLMLGNYDLGLAACDEAIALIGCASDIFLRHIQAATLDSVGYAHYHLGHHDEAIASYQEALRVYQNVGEARFQATTFDHLGDVYLARGDQTAARDAWKRALAILDDLRHPGAKQLRARLHTSAGTAPADRPG
jgi:tetratricopeptide (TPR) repeat protein/transcriptional regulator with XRE-family HTH domain